MKFFAYSCYVMHLTHILLTVTSSSLNACKYKFINVIKYNIKFELITLSYSSLVVSSNLLRF